MKSKIIAVSCTVSFMLLMSCGNNANITEKKVWVRGNCDMCKDRIETHVKRINGVKSATWTSDNEELKVSFDSTKTNQDAIETICAKVGHATKNKISEGKVIDELPECCRPEEK